MTPCPFVLAEDKAPDVSSSAPQTGVGSTAKVKNIIGEAKFQKKGQASWEILQNGMALNEGDSVRTAPESIVTLELFGSEKTAEVILKPESYFTLQTFSHDAAKKTENTLLSVQAGSILVKAQKLVGESKFEVKTPTSIVGIRGTTFEVQVQKS